MEDSGRGAAIVRRGPEEGVGKGGGGGVDPAPALPFTPIGRAFPGRIPLPTPRTTLKVCEAGALSGVTTLRACPGSARHPFIASDHPSDPSVVQRGGAPATRGQPLPREPRPEEEPKARLTLAGPAGDGDHHHADVRQGLGAASGLRSRGRPPPGWRRGALLGAAGP